MSISRGEQLPIRFDDLFLSALDAQVRLTIKDKQRRPKVLEKLLARDTSIEYLVRQGLQEQELDLDVSGGFAREYWRQELLGIVDYILHDRLIAALPVMLGASRVSLSRAQVESQTAPDIWVFVAFRRVSRGVSGLSLGWELSREIREIHTNEFGRREIVLSDLRVPTSLLRFVNEPAPERRKIEVTLDPIVLEGLRGWLDRYEPRKRSHSENQEQSVKEIQPLSLIEPEVFDCLVANEELARKYLKAIAQTPSARSHLRAPEQWFDRGTAPKHPPQVTFAKWLPKAAENSKKKGRGFWSGKVKQWPQIAGLSAMMVGAATVGKIRVSVVNQRMPDRVVEFRVPPEAQLVPIENSTHFHLIAQTSEPIDAASLLVLDSATIERLRTMLNQEVDAVSLVRRILHARHAEAEDYIAKNALTYPAEVRAGTILEIDVPLPMKMHQLPPDIDLVLLVASSTE